MSSSEFRNERLADRIIEHLVLRGYARDEDLADALEEDIDDVRRVLSMMFWSKMVRRDGESWVLRD